MIRFILITLATILFLSSKCFAISDWTEDFTSCSPLECGCGDGCGQSAKTEYSFTNLLFKCIQSPEQYWTNSSHQTSGGINNSPYFRGVVPTPACTPSGADNDAYMMIRTLSSGDSTTWQDSSFYMRIAMRFSSGWYSGGNAELKIWYQYPQSGNPAVATMYWQQDESSQDYFTWYDINAGVYFHHHSNNTNASHEYSFRLSQHLGKWFVFVYWFDWSTTTHLYKYWLTTEDGVTNCSTGTACLVNGVYEFNEFLYIDTAITGGAVQLCQRYDLGFFVNKFQYVAAGSTIDFDSFAVSENPLTSNVFTGTTPPSAQGCTISGGTFR